MNNTPLPIRKKVRLNNYDYSMCGVYFITICTSERENYFWKSFLPDSSPNIELAEFDTPSVCRALNIELSPFGIIADAAINRIPSVYPNVSIDYYVIMPDHLHLLLRISANDNAQDTVIPKVSRIINQLKGNISKQIGGSLWQKSFYDHIILNNEDYEKHVRYICENPIRRYYKD